LRFSGYIAIPHELLHVAGYRLVGKQCNYKWGQPYVKPIGPMRLWEEMVGSLFPFVVLGFIFLVLTVLSGLAYRQVLHGEPSFWLIIWTSLAIMVGSYAGTVVDDLRQSYLLISGKPWYSWTPFDIFYWPAIDWSEIRKKMAQEKDAEQD
jgi:hypothetical protein